MKSKCIREWKDKIMSELSQDDRIIEALGLNDGESPDDLIWNRLFPHLWIPTTEDEVKSYIMVEIQIPERRSRSNTSESDIWVHPIVVFDVMVHQEDMHMNLAGESGTRMDYLAELVEDAFDGRKDFGVGILKLKSDLADSINTTYRVRHLVFETVDVVGVCG